jgi:hypothetical protein
MIKKGSSQFQDAGPPSQSPLIANEAILIKGVDPSGV